MYIIKNAFKNLGRNKGRNILLGIIILATIISTTVALVINTTTTGIIEDYKTRFGSKVTLSVDFEKLMGETNASADGSFAFPTATEISPEQYMEFAKSKNLKSYLMNSRTGIAFEKLKAVDEKENNNAVGSIGGNRDDEFVNPTANLISYSDASKLPDFADGLRKIIEGSLYKGKNECIISSDFADLNKLKVGDEFQIIDSSNKKNTITLKVAGIYADATKANDSVPKGVVSLNGSSQNRRNEILVSLDTMMQNFNVSSLIVNAEYELKSPAMRADFEKELRDKGLPSEYNVETDEAGYNKIVAPVEGLSKISMTFMWVVLGIGGIVLLFITTLAIRERKYEIGVLRAMGMKKAKIAVMLVLEMVMLTTMCLGIGLGVVSAISQPVANSLISGQVEAIEKEPQSPQGGVNISGGTTGTVGGESDEKPLSELDVSLTVDAALQICMVALILALLSCASGVIFITKYEPMKILSERN